MQACVSVSACCWYQAKKVREMALGSKISEWDFGADHAQVQRQDPIYGGHRGTEPPSEFLPARIRIRCRQKVESGT